MNNHSGIIACRSIFNLETASARLRFLHWPENVSTTVPNLIVFATQHKEKNIAKPDFLLVVDKKNVKKNIAEELYVAGT